MKKIIHILACLAAMSAYGCAGISDNTMANGAVGISLILYGAVMIHTLKEPHSIDKSISAYEAVADDVTLGDSKDKALSIVTRMDMGICGWRHKAAL